MRSLLFVPGHDEKKLGQSLACGADAIIVDLEDSVAAAAKPEARVRARAFLSRARALERRPRLIVRVNPLTGGETDRDLEAVMPGAPDGIMLPKSLGGASVQELSVKLGVREALEGLPDGATAILAIATETAEALFAMASYRGASARLMGLAWGPEALSADLGAETNRDDLGGYASPYRLARDLTLFGATAAGVAPIQAGDSVGAYRLIAPLHEGGMGVVFLAERADQQAQQTQDEVRRVVGFSVADEIKKLDELKKSGSITDQEYARLRGRLVQ